MLRELFVSRLGGQLWSALREDGKTVELRVERAHVDAPVGRIIKARVTSILPGIQSAFLDIGTERGAFLHARDLLLPGETLEGSEDQDPDPPSTERHGDDDDGGSPAGPTRPGVPNRSVPPIQDRLAVGRDLLVQITRERLGSKGAKVTSLISLAGRLVVLLPQARNRGVSRRIEDPQERERLRGIVDRLEGEGVGFVARTAADGATEEVVRADADALMSGWCEVQDRAASLPAPSVVYPEPGLLLRLLRETPRGGLERIVLDDEADRRAALAFLGDSEPALAANVMLHTGPVPLFESFGLQRDIERALQRRVWLESGGYLVIEETEALVSIDVNTGKFAGREDLEQTALRTNLEATGEISRQLRLRDLGGIIVIDFIDMTAAENRRHLEDELTRLLRADPARTKVLGISELGLLQLTRKRTRPALGAVLTRSCPLCSGHGRVKAPRTVTAEVLSAVRRAEVGEDERLVVRVHPDAAGAVGAGLAEERAASRAPSGQRIRVEQDRTLRPDRFELKRLPR
jgi:ribonuclease G